MRKARLIVGRTAVGILVLAGGASAAHAGSVVRGGGALVAEDLSARTVATSLAGEWDGQIQVRASDGALSTSWVGVSAKLAPDGERLELYYEGFAFGKPVEGAMLLSFAENHEHLSIRDRAAGVRASCAVTDDASQPEQPQGSLAMSGVTSGDARDVRAVFSQHDDGSWSIEYQAKQQDGQWSALLAMSVNRLKGDRQSAAAGNFAKSPDLHALRSEQTTAHVDEQ